jgi:hypothetical protein
LGVIVESPAEQGRSRRRKDEAMSTYEINLLLEALVRVYSSQELAAAEPVVSCLVKDLGFENELAEVFVEGALLLKEARAKRGLVAPQDSYVQ